MAPQDSDSKTEEKAACVCPFCEEEVVVIPFVYNTVPVLIKSRVKGWAYNPVGGQQMSSWSLEN